MSENENRTKELRINEDDREAIKRAKRECETFDSSTAMGFVARIACKNMIED